MSQIMPVMCPQGQGEGGGQPNMDRLGQGNGGGGFPNLCGHPFWMTPLQSDANRNWIV